MLESAILLVRISDPKQDKGYSRAAQKQYGLEYCAKNNFELVAEPFDFIETASKPGERSKFDEMMKFIEKFVSKPNRRLHLVVEKKDRLTRNFTSQEQLQALVMQGKLVIHYYKDKKVIDVNVSPADVFNDDIQTAVAKYSSLNTRREVKKGMLQKARAGWLPGKAPLGYVNVRVGTEDRHGRKEAQIHVDPDHRNVDAVLRIFELRATTSQSYRDIARAVLSEGILSPHKTKHFGKANVANILTNRFYEGEYKKGGEWHKGLHQIFVPAQHLAVAFGKEKGPYAKGKRGLFSGFIRCADQQCRCQIIFDPKKRVLKSGAVSLHTYYRCSDGRDVHRDGGQKQVNVTEDTLFDEFLKPVRDISISDRLAHAISALLKRSHEKAIAAHRRTMDGYKQALGALERKEDELYDDLKRSLVDEATYHRRIQKIRDERCHFTGQLERGQEQIATAFYQTSDKILELAKNAESLWKERTPQERVDFLKSILSNQTLDGVTIGYELQKPFRIVAEMKKNEGSGEWRTRKDSNLRPLDS